MFFSFKDIYKKRYNELNISICTCKESFMNCSATNINWGQYDFFLLVLLVKMYIRLLKLLFQRFFFVFTPERNESVSTQMLSSTTVFNIDNNNNCFLRSISASLNDFWRSCDTEDWSNEAENTASITGINYLWKDIQIKNTYFEFK